MTNPSDSTEGAEPLDARPAGPPIRRTPAWVAVVVLVGLALVVLVLISLARPKEPTVRVTGCSGDGFMTTISYALTNNDRNPHDYVVRGTVGHSPGIPSVLKGVAPGETVRSTMISTAAGDCQITGVDQQ